MEKLELREKAIHGSPMFPLCVYEVVLHENEPGLYCHWHDELEIVYVKYGKILFQIGTSIIEASEGQAIFVNRGQIHAAYRVDNMDCRFYAIVFDFKFLSSFNYDIIQSSFINAVLDGTANFPQFINESSKWEKEALNEISLITDEYKAQVQGFQLSIKGRLYRILYLIAANNAFKAELYSYHSDVNRIERLKAALNYIAANHHKKIYVHELASLINMSEGHFTRFFRHLVGQSPVNYIVNMRIRHAAELIQTGEKTITEIAMDVGFDNISYFIKVFKGMYRCSPSQYRKKYSQ